MKKQIIVKPPYTEKSLVPRLQKSKLIRYSSEHPIGGIDLYLLVDFTEKIAYESNKSISVRGSVYYFSGGDVVFFAVWRIGNQYVDSMRFGSFREAQRAAIGAINISRGIVEHYWEANQEGYEMDMSDAIEGMYDNWKFEYRGKDF